jgi:hypothetical protein
VDGFYVVEQVLQDTATAFDRIVGQLDAARQVVAALTANTGRHDSDDAASSLFGSAARLLSSVSEGTADDVVSLRESHRTYVEVEADVRQLYGWDKG